MKIYYAGPSLNLGTATNMMNGLRAHGHTITYDWTKDVLAGTCDPEADLQGVKNADVMVIDCTMVPSLGAMIEVGYALANGVKVYCLGKLHPVFGKLDLVTEFDDIEKCMEELNDRK